MFHEVCLRYLLPLLVFTITSSNIFDVWLEPSGPRSSNRPLLTNNYAEAVAPAIAVAAPAAAIGALELAAVSASAALAIGIITVAENERYQQLIGQKIASIKNSTKEMLESTIEDALTFAKTIATKTQACLPVSKEKRSLTPTCNQSPEACCGDFLSKFTNRIQKSRGGFRIFHSPNNNKSACCLEWDPVHGAFEIFDNRGNHLGERGCEDLSDDPCKNTISRGKHALPSNKNHSPKSSLCKP